MRSEITKSHQDQDQFVRYLKLLALGQSIASDGPLCSQSHPYLASDLHWSLYELDITSHVVYAVSPDLTRQCVIQIQWCVHAVIYVLTCQCELRFVTW